jgi:hypothetical protein
MNRFNFYYGFKAIFLIALLFFSLPSSAKYRFYNCLKQEDVFACAGGCSKDQGPSQKNAYLDFKVNVSNNAVVTHIYQNNKYSHSWNYSECRVVDKKNWSCVFIKSRFGFDVIHEMRNGIFYHYEKGSENRIDQYNPPWCSIDTLF